MKKQKIVPIVIIMLLFMLAATAIMMLLFRKHFQGTEEANAKEGVILLGDITTCEPFKEVPIWVGEGTKMSEAKERGNMVYMIDVNGATKDQYDNYLKLLEKTGFKKHSDNGAEGGEGYIYASAFTKKDLTVTVSYSVKAGKSYLTASRNMPLSDYLLEENADLESNLPGAATKLHMVQVNENGNSFVVQLKNGHFLVHDGGKERDAPYLLDYLDNLTPGDEKPIIDAWFISHPHDDHYGAMRRIALEPEHYSRIYVKGIYFVEPSNEVISGYTANSTYNSSMGVSVQMVTLCANAFQSPDEKKCQVYRPQLGQRYYFSDTIVDVAFTSEQLVDADVTTDVNDTSTCFIHIIEGQRIMLGGDLGKAGTKIMMKHFDQEYFKFDVFSVLHHGINVYDYFTDYCDIKTLLYTSWRSGSIWTDGTWKEAAQENIRLKNSVEEYYHHGDGSVVLTFPYELGEAEIAEPFDWRYNLTKPGQPDRDESYWAGQ